MDLTAFAGEVGRDGPVAIEGEQARRIGGAVDPAARVVRAPTGVDWVAAAEMTCSCGAGTPIAELQAALREHGQFVALPDGVGTVGGALAVGRSGPLRLLHGPVRDTVLQVRLVTADGDVVKAGGPTVKNVSGFDLCRLFVGSLGTLGFAGEVILRTRPLPADRRWFSGPVDPFALGARLYRPAAVLWDGCTTWLCLEGHPADVAQQAVLAGLAEVAGPPPLPTGGRASLAPAALHALPWAPGTFVAEVGVGIVHLAEPVPVRTIHPAVADLHRSIKERFDPANRLNPGRDPLHAA
jgi:FAD/FMN-containing dehydrogenase